MARPRKHPLPVEAVDGYPMIVTCACVLLGNETARQGDRIVVPAHVRESLLRVASARDA